MAIKTNLVIDQGTTYSTSIDVLDDYNNQIDLTGYSAAAMMRKHYASSNATSFVTVVNVSTSQITLSLTANTTANLIAGRYVYDCELTDTGGKISRLVEGIVTITPQVTR
jgi:hypothetical protein